MITNLRAAVEWLITLKCAWTLDELAELGFAKRDRAQYYATSLVNQGVLTQRADGYHAGQAAAAWQQRAADSHDGGNAACYLRQRAIRERLRAKEFQALRAGTAINVPGPKIYPRHIVVRERARAAASADSLTCSKTKGGESRAKEANQGMLVNYLSPRQVAEQLGVCEATVLATIRRGDLPATRLGPRLLRIKEADVSAYIERGVAKLKAR